MKKPTKAETLERTRMELRCLDVVEKEARKILAAVGRRRKELAARPPAA